MSYIWLQNATTGEIVKINTPFKRQDYFDALNQLGVEYDEEEADSEEIENVDVVEISTETPVEGLMESCNHPLLINLAEELWGDCDTWTPSVEAYIDWAGCSDLEVFCNLCLQSEDINYYTYEYGESYEGYGREVARSYFECNELPDWIEDYIDYYEFGRDRAMDGEDYVGEYGYISGYDCGVDETYYTFNEMMEDSKYYSTTENHHANVECTPVHTWEPKPLTQDVLLQML